jgi:hypothetical protein
MLKNTVETRRKNMSITHSHHSGIGNMNFGEDLVIPMDLSFNSKRSLKFCGMIISPLSRQHLLMRYLCMGCQYCPIFWMGASKDLLALPITPGYSGQIENPSGVCK